MECNWRNLHAFQVIQLYCTVLQVLWKLYCSISLVITLYLLPTLGNSHCIYICHWLEHINLLGEDEMKCAAKVCCLCSLVSTEYLYVNRGKSTIGFSSDEHKKPWLKQLYKHHNHAENMQSCSNWSSLAKDMCLFFCVYAWLSKWPFSFDHK